MKQHFFILALSAIGLSISSCSEITPLKTGAENVVITNTANLPQCKSLGPVHVNDVNGNTIEYTSHKNLDQEAANTLRNDALKRGGNVVVITEHNTTYSRENQVDTHDVDGEVYLCPKNDLPKWITIPEYKNGE